MSRYNNLPEALRWEAAGLFESRPGAQPLFEAFADAVLLRFPDTEIRIGKTQAGFFDGCGYAIASPLTRWKKKYPGPAILITLGLPMKLDSPRIEQVVEPYPGRFTHHLVLTSPEKIDEELLGWLDTAHGFAQMKRRRSSQKGEN